MSMLAVKPTITTGETLDLGPGDGKLAAASDVFLQPNDSDALLSGFKGVLGDMSRIFAQPNVRPDHEWQDISDEINGFGGVQKSPWKVPSCGLLALTGVGTLYLAASTTLIDKHEFGFSLDNGKPVILFPGWHCLASPFNKFAGRFEQTEPHIHVGSAHIIRVPKGRWGFAMNNQEPEVLLPGVHVRNSPSFVYHGTQDLDQELIQFGPLKFVTVKSGGVRVVYINGKVKMLSEGRFAINSPTVIVDRRIDTQQTNLRFEKHHVLLDGGITLSVEGLLTYQIVDVEKLILQLGGENLVRAIQDVTKAELARVFAGLHLEQISQGGSSNDQQPRPALISSINNSQPPAAEEKEALLGKERVMSTEGQTRMWICEEIVRAIEPLAGRWGVNIINFQLESTQIAEERFAREYEEASLAIAKAKANLRAVAAQNSIKLQTAEAAAMAMKIEAEGRKAAEIIQAQGAAEARKIEALARNEAALRMSDPFAKEFALRGLQVDFAKALKANVLAVLPDSTVGRNLAAQSFVQPLLAQPVAADIAAQPQKQEQ